MPATATHKRGVRPNLTPPVLLHQVEQYICPGCESQIRTEHVERQIDKRLNFCAALAWCPHCQSVWHAEMLLEGGIWRVIGAVNSLNPALAYPAEFLARCRARSGELQLNRR